MEIIDLLLDIRWFGIKVINAADFTELVVRFIFNLLITAIIVRGIYYPLTRKKDYLFTYLLFSVVIFFVCNLLSNAKISTGFALGLFAVFSIIRYRTDPIAIKEMTYLFIIMGISVVNALATKKVSHAELIFTNFAIILVTFFLERRWVTRHEHKKTITYEKIDLIKPENHEQMLTDLQSRTGLNITRFEIGRIDFLRDTATVRVFYDDPDRFE